MKCFCLLILIFAIQNYYCDVFPLVVNTWGFTSATRKAWDTITQSKTNVDAVVAGCTQCEIEQCDGTVGFGGSPDENGETTLDAMVMDGTTMKSGAVGALRRIKNAIGVARFVKDHTLHSILVGDFATNFAIQMGFHEESLTTNSSWERHLNWKNSKCQPNHWVNVQPNPKESCGPYRPLPVSNDFNKEGFEGHDTVSMVVVDRNGHFASGSSSNGLTFKVPGRVGDAPIVGSGSYADDDLGGCGATGDGDVMLRFLPCISALQLVGMGVTPKVAAETSIRKIIKHFPSFTGAIFVVSKSGVIGAACHNWVFTYSYMNSSTPAPITVRVDPI
jgi:N4-(beta-N-acetylglucosaminyl)-L-asparaginase